MCRVLTEKPCWACWEFKWVSTWPQCPHLADKGPMCACLLRFCPNLHVWPHPVSKLYRAEAVVFSARCAAELLAVESKNLLCYLVAFLCGTGTKLGFSSLVQELLLTLSTAAMSPSLSHHKESTIRNRDLTKSTHRGVCLSKVMSQYDELQVCYRSGRSCKQ